MCRGVRVGHRRVSDHITVIIINLTMRVATTERSIYDRHYCEECMQYTLATFISMNTNWFLYRPL